MLGAKSDTRKETGIVLFLVGLLPPLSVAEQVRRRPKLVMDEGGLLHYYWGRRFKIDRGGPIPRGIANCNANGAEKEEESGNEDPGARQCLHLYAIGSENRFLKLKIRSIIGRKQVMNWTVLRDREDMRS